jgi:hypothetical protein
VAGRCPQRDPKARGRVEHNPVGDDRATSLWSSGYYFDNARFRLEALGERDLSEATDKHGRPPIDPDDHALSVQIAVSVGT